MNGKTQISFAKVRLSAAQVGNDTDPYPVIVQTSNATNYAKAVAEMGGDDINTKVWGEK